MYPLHINRCSTARALSALSIISGAVFTVPAFAAMGTGDTPGAVTPRAVTPYVDYTVFYEDNLLRFYDSAAAKIAEGSGQMSDTVRRATGGLRFSEQISQQHFTADISLNRSSFDHFNQFDNTGEDLLANWNWHIGNNLEGNASTNYSESLTPFDSFRTVQSNLPLQGNVRRQWTNSIDAGWRFGADWRMHGAITHYQLSYDLDALHGSDQTQDTTELGLDYLAPSSSTIGVQLRHIRGGCPDSDCHGLVLGTNYIQNEVKGKIDWQVSGKSRIQFLGGWVQRNYDTFSTENFNGTNARLIGTWAATGKIGVAINVWREVSAVADLTANYALVHGVSLGGGWDVTSKLRIESSFNIEQRDYNGVAVLGGVTTATRIDRDRKAGLGLTYLPYSHLQLSAAIFHETLNSTITQLGFRANGAHVNAHYEF